METLTSLKNGFIQQARSLNSAKNRRETVQVLLTGLEHIRWAIQSGWQIEYIITSLSHFSTEDTTLLRDIKQFKASNGLLKKITDTKYLIDTIAVGTDNVRFNDDDFILVLDHVQDFGNIGTIIRTAQAFNISNLIATRQDGDVFHKKTIDASRGTVFSTGIKYFDTAEDTIRYLKDKNYQIVTTSPYGTELQSLASISDRPLALIVGNETNGACEAFLNASDISVQIPMHDAVESLNVGVAAGISLYELKLKQVIEMIESKIKSTLGRELNVGAMLMQRCLDNQLSKLSQIDSLSLIFLMVLKCDQQMTREAIQKQFAILDHEFGPFIENLKKRELLFEDNGVYRISQSGIDLIGKLWPIVEKTESNILNNIAPEDLSAFYKVLNIIQKNATKMLQSD